jgi:hypothetical protein
VCARFFLIRVIQPPRSFSSQRDIGLSSMRRMRLQLASSIGPLRREAAVFMLRDRLAATNADSAEPFFCTSLSPTAWVWHANARSTIETKMGRRLNLRPATQPENLANRGAQQNSASGIKGVCFDRARNKWIALIKAGAVRRQKRFNTKEAAADAVAAWRQELHREFANHGKEELH